MKKVSLLNLVKKSWTRKVTIFLLAVLAFIIPYTTDSLVVFTFLGLLIIIVAILGMNFCMRKTVLAPWQKSLFFLGLAYEIYFVFAALMSSSDGFRMVQWGWLLSGLSLLIAVVFMVPSRKETEKLLLALVAGGVVSGLLGVWQYLFLGQRAHGLNTMNSNIFGAYLATVAPVAISWFFAAHRKREKVLAGAAALIVVAALIFTFCRGSLLALFAAGFCMSWWLRSYWILPGLAGYYYVLSRSIAPLAYKRFVPLVTGSRDASITERLQLWRAALELWKRRPFFGVGIGHYRLLAPDFGLPKTAIFDFGSKGRHSLSCHNSYLEILAEQGLVGLMFLLALLVVFFFPVLRRLFIPDFESELTPVAPSTHPPTPSLSLERGGPKTGGELVGHPAGEGQSAVILHMGAGFSKSGFITGRKPADPWLAGMAGGVVGFLVHNLTNSLFLYNGVSWAGWLLLGLAACWVRTGAEGGEPACAS